MLFNNIGTETFATELRVRTLLEMLLYESTYLGDAVAADYLQISPSYDHAVQCCSSVSGYSCIWTIAALSTVLQRRIVLIYPDINGVEDQAQFICSRVVQPKRCENLPGTQQQDLYIMWTCDVMMSGTTWEPNHFVPVVEMQEATSTSVDSTALVFGKYTRV